MKRILYLPLTVLLATPSFAADDVRGDLNVGLRATHFASDEESAKYNEYLDMSDGLFGDVNVLFDNENYFIGFSASNPGLDDQSYELRGQQFGLAKGRIYFDELTHQLSLDALSPATGIGSNYLRTPNAGIPASVPPVSAWTPFDYDVERKVFGTEFTIDPQDNPFYLKASMEQQQHDGIMPWGTTNFSFFELPMPVDYTTNNLTIESGYRSKETTAVFTAGYSVFDNHNDLLTVNNGTTIQQYSTPADNYSYNFGGRLVQRLPMKSVLALNAGYTRNISDADWSQYTQFVSPFADKNYDGDVEYIRGGGALTSQWSTLLDTRMFYNYVDRNNSSDNYTAPDTGATNHLFEYNRHKAGLDANYRLDKANKLGGGYEFSHTNRNREDSDSTSDNLVFAQLKNTTLEWMSTNFRLEYMNRSSDSNYSAATLAGDGLIHQYFTPFDNASKDRYKAKVAFDFILSQDMDLGLSYALVQDQYNATQLGLQDDQRQEIYADFNALLPAKIRLNTHAGYEYTNSNYDARRFNPGGANPAGATNANNFNWSQETTYDFIVIGGSLTVPVRDQFDLVFSVEHQLVDGNIDFARSAAAGTALVPIADADDYYKTQFGAKSIFQATKSVSITLGYLFEKSNLDEWKYVNYTYTPGTYYLSGAGLDSDYEAHQVYVMTKYHF
jgi:MtrB/PioB family decaheme-associated outer membrane protein